MEKISILIPVYNAEKYLERCLKSVRNQTYQQLEILLIDDGSTDASGSICNQAQKEDPRIRVFYQENQGVARTRNRAVKLAEGDWVTFVDADDVIHPKMVERLVSLREQTGCDIAGCEMTEGDHYSPAVWKDWIPEVQCYECKDEVLASLLEQPYFCWTPTVKLFRKQALIDSPFPQGRIYEDNAVIPLIFAKNQLYFYQKNPKGISKIKTETTIWDSVWAYDHLVDMFRLMGYEKCHQKVLKDYFKNFVWKYNAVKDRDPDLADRIRERAQKEWKERKHPAHLSYREKRLLFPVIGMRVWFG